MKEVMTPNDVARYVGCAYDRVMEAARDGSLKAYVAPWSEDKSRRFLRIYKADVDRWVRGWVMESDYHREER